MDSRPRIGPKGADHLTGSTRASRRRRWALFQRRHVYVPTLVGWSVILICLGAPVLLWWFEAEPFLATTQRVSADILVVEGWIGVEGAQAAAEEFMSGGYRYAIATGGLTGAPWSRERWSHAEVALRALIANGVPRDRVILARPPADANGQRTYASALAARKALEAAEIAPGAVTVFTRFVHARRSRLVFAKAFGEECPVGVVAWIPPGSEDPAWWRYSYRADELLKESVGYVLELLFSSGRLFTTSAEPDVPNRGDR